MIVPAPPMHQYDDTPMMVSVLYWKKKKKIDGKLKDRLFKICIIMYRDYSQNVPKSKRPLVKTSPNWSKRPQKLVKTSPWSKMLVKTSPKLFLLYILCNFRHDLGCLNETVLDKVFLSRFYSVISVK